MGAKVQQSGEALHLFKRVHVAALQVLNDGRFEGLDFGQVHDADGRIIESGPLRERGSSGQSARRHEDSRDSLDRRFTSRC